MDTIRITSIDQLVIFYSLSLRELKLDRLDNGLIGFVLFWFFLLVESVITYGRFRSLLKGLLICRQVSFDLDLLSNRRPLRLALIVLS